MTMTLEQMRARAREREAALGFPRRMPTDPMIDWSFNLEPAARTALERFRDAHPFRVEADAFDALVGELYGDLARAFDVPAPTVHRPGRGGGVSNGGYRRDRHHVLLVGRTSVITALHLFARALGYGATGATWWANNTFRLIWPLSFGRLIPIPHSGILVRGGEATARRTRREGEAWWRAFCDAAPAARVAQALRAQAAAQGHLTFELLLDDGQRVETVTCSAPDRESVLEAARGAFPGRSVIRCRQVA